MFATAIYGDIQVLTCTVSAGFPNQQLISVLGSQYLPGKGENRVWEQIKHAVYTAPSNYTGLFKHVEDMKVIVGPKINNIVFCVWYVWKVYFIERCRVSLSSRRENFIMNYLPLPATWENSS